MNNIVVNGPWTAGLVLDRHTESSIYLGDDSYGYPRFDNTRSDLGEFVYDIKYDSNYIDGISNTTVKKIYERYKDIVEEDIKRFFDGKNINYIIAAPSSKDRKIQPVHIIATFISYMMGIPYMKNILTKTTGNPSKNMNLSEKKNLYKEIEINDIELFEKHVMEKNILIVDDLYQSGETLKACTNVLKNIHGIGNIYVLAMTKTKW